MKKVAKKKSANLQRSEAKAIMRDDLQGFVDGLSEFIEENPSYYLAPPGVAKNVVNAIGSFLKGDYPSLDHAFGFVNSRGQKPMSKIKKVPEYLITAAQLNREQYTWPEIAEKIDCAETFSDLRKKVKRYAEVIHQIETERLVESYLARSSNRPK